MDQATLRVAQQPASDDRRGHPAPGEEVAPRGYSGQDARPLRLAAGRRAWAVPGLLLTTVLAAGGALAAWKSAAVQAAEEAAASRPEAVETVTATVATPRAYQPSTIAVGTVLALRSVTLRNELPGTVARVALTPGEVVEAGALLVALDVSVERAELAAQRARATLAETQLHRMASLRERNVAPQMELDRARAERDVARAEIARIEAVIERKTLRAPFRARVGIADVHPGQFLEQGTVLTTLQGVGEAVHVDFEVPQGVASGLREGDLVELTATDGVQALPARLVAVDARVDPGTRNATVRARVEDAARAPAPGASVRVAVPTAAPREAPIVPLTALRKDAEGDHVFVLVADPEGQLRAHLRPVRPGPTIGREVVILEGLDAGERVAASGSFKLQEGTAVSLAESAAPLAHTGAGR